MKDSRIVLRLDSKARRRRYDLVGAVKITPAAEVALRELSAETGLSMRHIASELIVQAASIVTIAEVNDEEADE